MNWVTPNERKLLAAVLHEPRHLADASDIRREHFLQEKAQRVWATIVELDTRQQPVTSISIARKLNDTSIAAQLEKIREVVISGKVRAAETSQHADQVIDDAVSREALVAVDKAMSALRDPAASGREAVAVARELLERIEQPKVQRYNGRDLLIQLWENCEKWRLTPEDQRVWPSVRTGFSGLDRATGGLRLGQMHCLAAASSAGKSSMANAIICNAALAGTQIDLYGFEDEPEAVIARLAARVAKLSNSHLQSADLNGADPAQVRQDWEAAQEGFERISIVYDRPSSVTDLCLQIREGCSRRGTKLVVLDYLQLIKQLGEGRSNYDRLSHIAAELFHTARRAGCALLILSQLSRAQDKNRGAKPTMERIKDCGDVENFCYSVILLWARRLTQEVVNGNRTHERVIPVTELLVDKNKNGPVGDEARSLLHFDARSTTFYDLDRYDDDYDAYVVAARKASRA